MARVKSCQNQPVGQRRGPDQEVHAGHGFTGLSKVPAQAGEFNGFGIAKGKQGQLIFEILLVFGPQSAGSPLLQSEQEFRFSAGGNRQNRVPQCAPPPDDRIQRLWLESLRVDGGIQEMGQHGLGPFVDSSRVLAPMSSRGVRSGRSKSSRGPYFARDSSTVSHTEPGPPSSPSGTILTKGFPFRETRHASPVRATSSQICARWVFA